MTYRAPFPKREEVEAAVDDAKDSAQRTHLAAERARYSLIYRTRRNAIDFLAEARTLAVRALAQLDAARDLILEQCSCEQHATPQDCEVHRISR